MSRLFQLLSFLVLLSACGNKESSSAFDEILSQPPYATITDSIKKEPGRDDLYFNRAVQLNKNNFPEPALADFKKAWSLRKEEKYALAISTLLQEKKPDSAIVFLNHALNEVTNSFLLHLSLAHAYDENNKLGRYLGKSGITVDFENSCR